MAACSWYADEWPAETDEHPVSLPVSGLCSPPVTPSRGFPQFRQPTPRWQATPKSRQPTPRCREKQPVPIPPSRCSTADVFEQSVAEIQMAWSKDDSLQCTETMSMVPLFTSHAVHNDADGVQTKPVQGRLPDNFQGHPARGAGAGSLLRLPPGKHLLRHGKCCSSIRAPQPDINQNINRSKNGARTLNPGRHVIHGGKLQLNRRRLVLLRLLLLQRCNRGKEKMSRPFRGLLCILPCTVAPHTLSRWQVAEFDSDAHMHCK